MGSMAGAFIVLKAWNHSPSQHTMLQRNGLDGSWLTRRDSAVGYYTYEENTISLTFLEPGFFPLAKESEIWWRHHILDSSFSQ